MEGDEEVKRVKLFEVGTGMPFSHLNELITSPPQREMSLGGNTTGEAVQNDVTPFL